VHETKRDFAESSSTYFERINKLFPHIFISIDLNIHLLNGVEIRKNLARKNEPVFMLTKRLFYELFITIYLAFIFLLIFNVSTTLST
jgi:hypothetical protein